MIRSYTVEDDGTEIQVALFEDGEQCGGGVFPSAGLMEDSAWDDACLVGESWCGNVPG